ncbi:hypothetical protein M885DRAFT_497360 [Pelagophyceae sp. CCMP2097]|nr:hypothetical protein M885DRAFT_497360 [Pelagophyceae sp. CCMP2097]
MGDRRRLLDSDSDSDDAPLLAVGGSGAARQGGWQGGWLLGSVASLAACLVVVTRAPVWSGAGELVELGRGPVGQTSTLQASTADFASADLACAATAAQPALGGVDVIAFHALEAGAAPVAGSRAHAFTVGGAAFLFSTAANRAAFVSAPDLAPEYGGFCAWAVLFDEHRNALAWPVSDFTSADAWALLDGKLYLFLGKDERDQFLADGTAASEGPTATVQDRVARADAAYAAALAANVVPAPFFVAACAGCDCACAIGADGGTCAAAPPR